MSKSLASVGFILQLGFVVASHIRIREECHSLPCSQDAVAMSPSSKPSIVGSVSVFHEANAGASKGAVNEVCVSERSSSSTGEWGRTNILTTTQLDVAEQAIPTSSRYPPLNGG